MLIRVPDDLEEESAVWKVLLNELADLTENDQDGTGLLTLAQKRGYLLFVVPSRKEPTYLLDKPRPELDTNQLFKHFPELRGYWDDGFGEIAGHWPDEPTPYTSGSSAIFERFHALMNECAISYELVYAESCRTWYINTDSCAKSESVITKDYGAPCWCIDSALTALAKNCVFGKFWEHLPEYTDLTPMFLDVVQARHGSENK